MTTTHTPGPWEVHYSARGLPLTLAGFDVRPAGSALFVATSVTNEPFRPRAESLANAVLIAQAPALLAALERLCFAAECRDNTMGDPCRLLEVKAALLAASQEARDVIAAAKGLTRP